MLAAQTDEVRTLDHTGIGAAYATIGSRLTHRTRLMRLVNLTDADMMFSDDGVHDKWPVPKGSAVIYDYAANSNSKETSMAYPLGTQLYVKQLAAPSTGAVYIECTHAKGE